MKKSMILTAILAVFASSSAHGWYVFLKNATGKAVKVNIGCVAMPGSFHIAMAPGERKVLDTYKCKSCNGVVNYIPQWISAYMYEGHWENEKTIQEDKNIQDVGGCSGNRHITIWPDKITCDRGGISGFEFDDDGSYVWYKHEGDASRYSYQKAIGWDY